MEPTSLHRIITRDSSPLRPAELTQLFVPQQYPRFELHDLSSSPQMQNPKFAFFVEVLQRWNSRLGHSQATQMEYRKNEFVFSWLKSISVQNSKHLEASLSMVYDWYSAHSERQPDCQLRKENAYRSRMEDWQIRNSYKSNMPLQINQFRRRALLGDQTPLRNIHQNTGKTAKDSNREHKENGQLQALLSPVAKNHRKENNYIRGVREERQMADYLVGYKRTKVNFFKNMTKNYLRRQFSRDKLESQAVRSIRERENRPEELLKSYRIKTAAGLRPFGKRGKDQKELLSQTASSQFYRPGLEESLGGSPERLPASKVDGLGLLVNPFEVKPKKKKR